MRILVKRYELYGDGGVVLESDIQDKLDTFLKDERVNPIDITGISVVPAISAKISQLQQLVIFYISEK